MEVSLYSAFRVFMMDEHDYHKAACCTYCPPGKTSFGGEKLQRQKGGRQWRKRWVLVEVHSLTLGWLIG